ncbi:MAG: alpha/beta hydrolase [Acidobacteria bacterium]|nr:alpha/beta hydrolase [Acidobacteriota bacterium]MCA1639575.1 alpha/beta hydrolase [Acidobacteriota bacterium]
MKKKNLALGAGGTVGAIVAWKMLTRAGKAKWEDVADTIHHRENSHFAEVDGARIHYQEFGDKSNPTLLLVHGYTASTYVWKTVVPVFAEKDFHVIAVDLLGFGYSEKPKWFDYSINAQAQMIVNLMNQLNIKNATFVGSSYGGAVASVIALDFPEKVEKLVLVSAVCNDEAKNNRLLKLASLRGVGETVTPFLLGSKRFLRYRMRHTIAPANHHLITKERIEAVGRPLRAKDAHHSVLTSARKWDANRIENEAHLIKQPTLLIWGEEDTVIPLRNGEKLHQSISNSRFIVLKNCGHVPPEESPECFVELVTEFVKDKKGKSELER